MTDFPDIKLKVIPQFPADVRAGTNITITKENGVYTINSTAEGGDSGIEEAPIDGAIYARKNGAWLMLYASDVPPPAPGGGDFTTSITGAGSFIVPAGKSTMTGEAWGGGGCGSGYGASGGAGQGGGGGGYSRFSVGVTPGQTIYYFVGEGGGTATYYDGKVGRASWINPAANVQPTSIGCVAGGGAGGGGNFSGAGGPGPWGGGGGGGAGTIGTVNYNGGNGGIAAGGGGGGGAGSGGSGANATGVGPAGIGGAGGSPDGGAGGNGATGSSTSGVAGSPIGGGGGGSYGSVSAGNSGANGLVRLSFT